MDERVRERTAELLRSLGNPVRLEILEYLRAGERCVCEIVPALRMEQSSVSKHLAILKTQGLVDFRRDGTRVLYSIKTPRVFDLIDLALEVLSADFGEKSSLWRLIRRDSGDSRQHSSERDS